MSMFHPNHPDGNYQMANRVQKFDPPSTISWEPGYDAGDGTLRFGGWTWRYDLTPAGPSNTTVTLSYDWSAVPDSLREHIGFPPCPPDHLGNALRRLTLVTTKKSAGGTHPHRWRRKTAGRAGQMSPPAPQGRTPRHSTRPRIRLSRARR